jgi:chromosome partitioning protein
MQGKFGDIIIDAGGRDTTGLRAALTIADIALVPFQPRSFDLWTLEKVAALITEAQGYRQSPLKAVAILNFADPQGADNAQAAEALRGSEVLAYLDTPIGRRKAFPNAAAEGRGVCELRPPDPKASTEIAALSSSLFTDVQAISE